MISEFIHLVLKSKIKQKTAERKLGLCVPHAEESRAHSGTHRLRPRQYALGNKTWGF